jgi:hypothetical protein
MRSLVAVCLLSGIASADPALPVDAVMKGQVDDWTIFESEKLVDGKLVKERALSVIAASGQPFTKRVFWFSDEKDKEAQWRSDNLTTVDTRLIGVTVLDTVKDLKSEAATCKLDTSFACTKVTYSGDARNDPKKQVAVTAMMAPRIKGSGIVELTVTQGTTVVWKLKAIGYGNREKSDWGVPPSKTKIEIPDEAGTLGSVGVGGFGPGPDTQNIGKLSPVETKGGDLDKAIVRRYLKRNYQRLVYCYEKEQLAKPKIAGKLVIKFEISGEGKVTSATTKGVDPEVERCVATVIKNIELPKPKDGKVVEVTTAMTYAMPKPFAKKN